MSLVECAKSSEVENAKSASDMTHGDWWPLHNLLLLLLLVTACAHLQQHSV